MLTFVAVIIMHKDAAKCEPEGEEELEKRRQATMMHDGRRWKNDTTAGLQN